MRGSASLRQFLLCAAVAGSWLAAQPAAAQPDEDTFPPSNVTENPSVESSETPRRGNDLRSVIAGPVDPASYRLGPGDVLSLEYGGRASGSRSFIIDGEGRARVPSLGLVTLGGKTLDEARNEIVRKLRALLPGASMDLRLLQPRTFKVFVLGDVKKPGTQNVVGSARVSEAIESGGGLNPSASIRNIQLLRRDGHREVADLDRFQRTGDWEANPYLLDGDRIVVPVATQHIGVFGSVAQPGNFEFHEGDSLGTAIRLAGGVLAEARLDSILVVRFRGANTLDSLYVSLEPGQAGAVQGMLLKADDRIFIRPEPQWHPSRQVVITGEVRFPGVYAIDEGKSRISDLLAWAGGFTEHAARRNVRLERHLADSDHDVEFERLSRLSREEMTNSEYQTFRSKLAVRQSAYLVDFTSGSPQPPATNVLLRDGDKVDVSRLELAVRVDGSVRNPGFVAYEEGRSVSDYIRMAGGTTRRGNSGDARLTRAGSSNTVFARDGRRIEPGDFIWVPERKDTSFWSVFKDVITVAGQVATIVILVDTVRK